MKMEAEQQKYGLLTKVNGSMVINDQQLSTSRVDGRGATLSVVTVSNFEIIYFIS